MLPGIANLGLEVGGSVLLGLLVGYAIKTGLKLVVIAVGVQVAILGVLESRGMIRVDWRRLVGWFIDALAGVHLHDLVVLAGGLLIGGGFTLGVLIGFTRG